MIEEEADVVAVRGDRAEISIVRQTACGSCAAKSGCGTSLLAQWLPNRQLNFVISNDVGAQSGDRVVVGLDEGQLQRASVLVYGLPLAGLVGGAIAGDLSASVLSVDPELASFSVGLLGLVGSLMYLRRLSRNRVASLTDIRLLRVVPRQVGVSFEGMPAPRVVGTGADFRKGK